MHTAKAWNLSFLCQTHKLSLKTSLWSLETWKYSDEYSVEKKDSIAEIATRFQAEGIPGQGSYSLGCEEDDGGGRSSNDCQSTP